MATKPAARKSKAVPEVDIAAVRKLIPEILEKTKKPISGSAIRKQLPKLYQPSQPKLDELLEELSHGAVVFKWGSSGKNPKPVFLSKNPRFAATESIKAALADPKLVKAIQKAAAKNFPFLPALERDELLTSALNQLLFEAQGLEVRIQHALLEVQPRAQEGAVGWLPDVRARLRPPVEKREFDETVLRLARADVFSLHEFREYLQIGEAEREQLVHDGKGNYYGGIAFIRPETHR